MIAAGLLFSETAAAQSFTEKIRGGLQTAARPSGLSETGDLYTIIGGVINAVLGILGVLLFALLVYAGFLWMTAGGNTEQVQKAKGLITNAVIGLIIIASAFAIADFVIGQLGAVTSGTGAAGGESPP
jgi:hypothetical protein